MTTNDVTVSFLSVHQMSMEELSFYVRGNYHVGDDDDSTAIMSEAQTYRLAFGAIRNNAVRVDAGMTAKNQTQATALK